MLVFFDCSIFSIPLTLEFKWQLEVTVVNTIERKVKHMSGGSD